MASFQSISLLPTLSGTLSKLGFSEPTEIQERALPALLKGDSVVGIAETGSGKTLAYALPALQLVKQLEESGNAVAEPGLPRAIVLVPASDLGEQVSRVFKDFTHDTRVRVRVALGGMKMAVVRRNVAQPFEILIATPGRLEQLLEKGHVSLGDVRFLVCDEADQILDQGFLPAVRRILRRTPDERQLALFSATVSHAVQDLVKEMFADAEFIETKGKHRPVESLVTINRDVPKGVRFPILQEILDDGGSLDGGTLIFSNTREQCDNLYEQLEEHGYDCSVYRGDMDKVERRSNLQEFRDGRIEILICTDLAARGLDVENVARVINYHLPRELKNYLHRVGRTARAGREGKVYNLVTQRDKNLIQRLESF